MKKYLIKFLDFIGLKSFAEEKLYFSKRIFFQLFSSAFNETILKQKRDYKTIPIIIISFNQLFWMKQLIDFLKKHNYNNIVILDNNSTYRPLLEYFNEIESSVIIHRLKENYGHLVFWKNEEIFNKYSQGYYALTDADIVPSANCPGDFLLHFKNKLDKNYKITKTGFSLKTDDIPNSNKNKDKILKWELKFRESKDKDGDFLADIDTTFALYQPRYKRQAKNFFTAIRMKDPYAARHGGWYVDFNKLTKEQEYYFKTCNASSSWRINEDGSLIDRLYG